MKKSLNVTDRKGRNEILVSYNCVLTSNCKLNESNFKLITFATLCEKFHGIYNLNNMKLIKLHRIVNAEIFFMRLLVFLIENSFKKVINT